MEIATAMEESNYIAVASSDHSSAFDEVNIELLIRRLDIMGLPCDLISLITAWLTDRKAYV